MDVQKFLFGFDTKPREVEQKTDSKKHKSGQQLSQQ